MKVSVLLFLSLLSTGSFALGLPTVDIDNRTRPVQAVLNSDYDFNGIVKLSNCSGSIIKFAGQNVDSPAIMMTNGHCVPNPIRGRRFLEPGEVVLNRAVKFRARVYDAKSKLIRVTSSKLLYATMTDTDVAYYELDRTYSEFAKLGVDSFELDSTFPTIGMNIDIVSGYWDRGYRCFIDGIVFALQEADWTWVNSIRYSDKGCDTIGGTSGSPIIQTGTRVAVGINNTGNKNGGECTLNNPCEETAQGDISVMLRSYGQQTYNIYQCLTPDFQIDLEKAGCNLPK